MCVCVFSTGEVPADRLLKKHQQIENLVTMVMAIVQDGDTIVDFCSGGVSVFELIKYLSQSKS